MVGQMKHTVEGGRYADIPIPDFVDIILNGDDEAMYYLLQKRDFFIKRRFHLLRFSA